MLKREKGDGMVHEVFFLVSLIWCGRAALCLCFSFELASCIDVSLLICLFVVCLCCLVVDLGSVELLVVSVGTNLRC